MRKSFLCLVLFLFVCIQSNTEAVLTHRYSFTNGETVAVDSVGGQNGTLENGAAISGNAVQLDGSNDYVNLPAAGIAINTFEAITLEMWSTQPTTNQNYSMTACFGGTWPNGLGQDYIMIATTRGDNVSRGAIANTPDSVEPWNDEVGVNGPELNDGLEHQYVLTISNTELAYYIDGQLLGTASMGATTISETSTQYAYLGRSVYTGDIRVNCSINEFRIYNSALTPEEVSQHYGDGPDVVGPVLVHRYSFTNGDTTAVDSVGGQDGTLENGAAISNNAVQLDGLNDYVNLPDGLITGYTAISFEAWFTCSASNGTWSRVWDFGDTNSLTGFGRDCLFFTPKSGSNTFRYAISDADPGFDHEESIETSPTAMGVPVYVAVVHNSTTGEVELYVNGVPAASGTFSIPLSSVNNVYSYLGRSTYNADSKLNGSIDEFRIYSSALTPGQIAQHYTYGPDLIGESLLVIQESNGATEVIEGNSTPDTYTIALSSQPDSDVTLTVDPDEQLDIGNGRGGPVIILFTPQDWRTPRIVTVRAYDDSVLESDPHTGIISHFVSSSDPNFNNKLLPSVRVNIGENECGAWGFLYSDYDFDCFVNFKDFALFALHWLSQFNNDNLEIFSDDWLQTTQPYDPNAEHGPIQDPQEYLLIEPNEVLHQIDEKVYGHFLEHIYHSANGGLWGELVWNRSLEQWPGGVGTWSIEGDELVQSSLNTDVRLLFGDTSWQNYEYTLEAKKTGGSEGFLIIFRANGDNFYWCNLGGWANTKHALEKSVTGPSRGIVGPQVTGSIATDFWYIIRIRCEANRFRVWLNDELIIDYTDNNNAHLSGQVGVGTWATTARFRNIVVKDLSGNTLFSGLPSVGSTQAVPTYWTGYGNSSFYLNTSALNSDFCLQINKNDSAESGIEQTPFNIKVQQYTGSVWARGTATGSMVVRLLDGPTVLGQSILPAPNANWTEYPFSITPSEPELDATLQVGVSGSGTLYLDQISMMGQDSIAMGGYRPDLLQAVDDLRPPVIRWPGGYFAEMYRWKSGIGPQSERIKYPFFVWGDLEVNSYGTDEFIAMCRIVGAEPLMVINIGNHDSAEKRPEYIQEALDWIEYCNGPAYSNWGSVRAANGHPEPYNVKYWEISNETWFMGAAGYSQAVQEFVPPMRAKDPNIKIAVCGSGGFNQSWNQTMINNCASIIDYISIHHYESPDAYQYGPTNMEAYIDELGDIIAASANPNIKVDMSEWNAQSTDWRTGLYAGGLLNAFEKNGDVFEIGGPALFLRHLSATDWDNAFINFDHTGWFPAPNYVVMKLWRDNYAKYRIAMTGSLGGLNAVATKSADANQIYFKVVNPTDQDIPVKLVISDSFDVGSASLKLVAPGSLSARNTLANPDAVHTEALFVSMSNQTIRFTMPPLSAGVVKVSRKE